MSQTSLAEVLEPSATFKKQATRSVIAISGFILVYFILLVLSVALLFAAIWAGIALISIKPGIWTVIGGLGIIGCGVMVFYFMVKFLFASHKEDRSDMIEITSDDQPLLFRTIHELADQIGTSHPKRIYLSPDVNAAVFYDSSFWSMFFPIKKNLKIGLGLVNSVNVSEFKAVIAHEFGHFSQKSMKVGSWVYGVNRILHDMLHNNNSYSRALSNFASLHGILFLFAEITIKIVSGIIWLLNQVYRVVNKTYLALSREMEFHADLVAASVCGSNNIISALKRAEFAEACYASTIAVCNEILKDKKSVDDFYIQHRTVFRHLAPLNGLEISGDLPVMKDRADGMPRGRVNFKDQWSSHPTLEDRQNYLQSYGLIAPVDETSAWSIFERTEEIKQNITSLIYNSVPAEQITGNISPADFEQKFTTDLDAFSFPEVFGQFYKNRQVSYFNPEEIARKPFTIPPFNSILGEEEKLLPLHIQCLEQDINILESIRDKKLDTSSFDFDGNKFKRNEASRIILQLQEELKTKKDELVKLEETLFRFFYAIQPIMDAEEYKARWISYFELRQNSEAFLAEINQMMEWMRPIYGGQTLENNEIVQKIDGLKKLHEPRLRQSIKQWMALGAFDKVPATKAMAENFLQVDYAYFTGTEYFDHELITLNNLAEEGWNSVAFFVHERFREIVNMQARVLEKESRSIPSLN